MPYPTVLHCCPVSPRIISLRIREGRVKAGSHIPYVPQPGDEIEKTEYLQSWVKRDGKFIGSLIGRDGKTLYTNEYPDGRMLPKSLLDQKVAYTVTAGKSTPMRPVAIHRKSKPCDLARKGPFVFEALYDHTIYLELGQPMEPGTTYHVECTLPGVTKQTFEYDTDTVFTEAVHVTHLGFRPDDPAKCAYLSCWAGTGGGIDYSDATMFAITDADGEVVYAGEVTLHRKADDPEDDLGRNYVKADVYRLDFSDFDEPGTYRICVNGIGCSKPFTIGADVWKDAFIPAARGFYHQRSGMALDKKHTDFDRPRGAHPDDGIKIYASTATLMETGNGLNRDDTNFGNLVAGKTDELVEGIWGAYFDAGDWDRRAQHLIATRCLLELAELFPEFYDGVGLNIPESGSPLPDIVSEALYNLDGYCRMQTAEGGVRGGVESEEHPMHGECSWNDSLTLITYAPGVWSTYIFAACAAQAARLLTERDPDRAAGYRERALRAMDWAETEFNDKGVAEKYRVQVEERRRLALVQTYRLTGDTAWHQKFLSCTAADVLDDETAWEYTRVEHSTDTDMLSLCRAFVLDKADMLRNAGTRTGYNWVKPPHKHAGHGVFSSPLNAFPLCRAHALTGDASYLAAAVLACQHGAGANPSNLCYTTDMGYESPRNPLHTDARTQGINPPQGITVFGPVDIIDNPMIWGAWAHELIKSLCYPTSEKWPVCESYWDVFWNPPVCEFTIQNPMTQVAYVWGYLAARK